MKKRELDCPDRIVSNKQGDENKNNSAAKRLGW